MTTELQIAVIAVTVTAIGWLVTHILAQRADRNRSKNNFRLEYTKQQLSELYGPLEFLILEGRQTFKDLLDSLGRSYVFVEGRRLQDDELDVWLFWVENDFMPRNKQIRDLLSEKTHLIEGEEMPQSFIDFVYHYKSWEINHLRWQKQHVEYSWHSKIGYPKKFEEEVLETFSMLKRRQASLMKQISAAETTTEIVQSRTAQQ